MPKEDQMTAEEAAYQALEHALNSIREGRSFLMEAGAGSGKTHTLTKVLAQIIADNGKRLLREGGRIACITYTNVASEEIASRIDNHPSVLTTTIHAFCWEVMGDFQSNLREAVQSIPAIFAKIEEAGGLGDRRVLYDLGFRSVKTDAVYLHHDDVLFLFAMMLENSKFRSILKTRFPFVLIDEYQDTDDKLAQELKRWFWDVKEGPIFGLFGDHWQKIYGNGCGKIESPGLLFIPKKSNFRSAKEIVGALNRMRPELPQQIVDPTKTGEMTVFHTNGWVGQRETKNHWQGDLPQAVAHSYLFSVKRHLEANAWDFHPERTKILMLTHKVLSLEMGYDNLLKVFDYNDSLTKKQDPHIEYMLDTVEPAVRAFIEGRHGDAMKYFSGKRPSIHTRSDKQEWQQVMGSLLEKRTNGTVGEVMEFLRANRIFHVPNKLSSLFADVVAMTEEDIRSSSSHKHLAQLFQVKYSEVSSFYDFERSHTPFAAKHGVKGEGYENVLIVFGRGWNHYDFNKMLENVGRTLNAAEQATFERNRNLFYVVCSRAKLKIALLFTQELSSVAIGTLKNWFGEANIREAPSE